jgi:hypothetical protein
MDRTYDDLSGLYHGRPTCYLDGFIEGSSVEEQGVIEVCHEGIH